MLNNYEKSNGRSGGFPDERPTESFSPQEKPLIRLSGLEKIYNSASGEPPALTGVDLDVYPGEFVAITGKSGAGKTTLINMITGVDRVTSGEVWVDDKPLHRMRETQLAQWRGLNMGIIYQSFHLMPNLSLLDNVQLPIDFCGLYRNGASSRRAMELLTQVELEDHAYKPPSAISGGQQQRVAIARALANDPGIIVADEPTGNLDSRTAAEIFELFSSFVDQGKTLLVVSHNKDIDSLATRVMEIADGEIINGNHKMTSVLEA